MHLSEATQLARELMLHHQLETWSFKLDHARQRCGACDFQRRCISLSKYFIQLNDATEVRDVILHEIAHALVGPGHAHDQHWRKVAVSIGARPEAYASATTGMPEAKWAIVCQGCNTVLGHRHRRSLKLKSRLCPHCHPARSKLTWEAHSAP